MRLEASCLSSASVFVWVFIVALPCVHASFRALQTLLAGCYRLCTLTEPNGWVIYVSWVGPHCCVFLKRGTTVADTAIFQTPNDYCHAFLAMYSRNPDVAPPPLTGHEGRCTEIPRCTVFLCIATVDTPSEISVNSGTESGFEFTCIGCSPLVKLWAESRTVTLTWVAGWTDDIVEAGPGQDGVCL